MNKQKFKPNAQASLTVEQEVAREFARIAKLNQDGKFDKAWDAANDLYSKYPNDPTANFVIALILSDNNQKDDALEYAEAAVKFAPNVVRNLVFLGKLYIDLGIIEDAPKVLHKAFAIDNSAYQAPWALGLYYLHSGQGNRALPYFDSALAVAPEQVKNEILLDRSSCCRDLGKVEVAEAGYKSLLDIPRYQVRALRHAATLSKSNQNSDYAEKVRNLLNDESLTSEDKSLLYLCLGRLYENGRDYDGAFLNFEKSRNLIKSDFDQITFVSQINDYITVFTRQVFEKFRDYGHTSNRPIFIVGMPRSGTTMTEQIIANHSKAEGVGELDRLGRMATAFSGSAGMRQILDKMSEVGPKQWKLVPSQYLNLINTLAPDAEHTVDKMPHNFLSLGFIHLCFPNAKIIHCTRNPLDNFVSAFQNSMSSFHDYSYNQTTYGHYYVKYLQLMAHWKTTIPNNIYESNYESLTASPETEVRKMLAFLDLPWEEACLKFNERKSTVRTFSSLQVRNPINTASVARWRNYEKHLGPLRAVLDGAGIKYQN